MKNNVFTILVLLASLLTTTGCVLIGNCTKGTCRNGQSTYQYTNGDLYVGEWHNYMLNGRGIFYFNSGMWKGSRYEGNWKNNSMSGQGTFYFANGDVYEGEWKNDKANGYGIFHYANGDRYEGDMKNNAINGVGTFYFANGDKYEGDRPMCWARAKPCRQVRDCSVVLHRL